MLLTCPHCATIFRVDGKLISMQGQSVRCSMCHHIWTATPISTLISIPVSTRMSTSATDLSVAQNRLKSLWKACFTALLAAALISSVIIHRGSITAYAPFLINGFNAIGLTIRPDLSQLQVVGLNASYTGDTMRLSGGLRNIGMWRNHAADLRVTVRGADGAVLHEITLSPDHDIINAKAESGFFVQLAFDANTEMQVTVTPLANRVYR
ncbi:zinc-ribbon domain-containing protein [Alphaproteobacteria bacterium]|nr:zinc-ribbon domain-containing protein [Alphaproteobacteria bacterium]